MKKLMAILLVLSMTLAFTACGKATTETPSNESKPAAEKQLHFVYVSPLLAHPVWLLAKDGFDAACKELDIKGDWVGPQNISPEEMAKLVETAVAQDADAIITQGLVPANPVNKAIEKGIPVLIVDSDIPDAKKLAFFGKDVKVQAQVLYDDVSKNIDKDAPINASIQVAALNYQAAKDQIDAVKEVFSKHPGGFKLVNISESKSDKMKATTEWQNTFKAYPEINVAINLAAEAGPACANVVKEMKIKDKVNVYAVDDIEETLALIKTGDIDGSVVTSFYNYGYQAAHWLYQNIKEGKKPEKVFNDAGTIIVNKDNVATYGDKLHEKVDLK